jgi:hypothetical protein
LKKIYIIIGVVLLLVVGYFLGVKITALIGGIMALFGLGIKQNADKIAEESKKEKRTVDQVKENVKSRKKRHKDISDKLNKFFMIFLIFIIFVLPVYANDGEPPPDINKLEIPGDYDELVKRYKEMALLAIEYQQLYLEAEQDIEVLIQSNENLQKLIEAQQEIIDSLLKGKGPGVIAGVNLTPGNIENTGIIVGIEYNF